MTVRDEWDNRFGAPAARARSEAEERLELIEGRLGNLRRVMDTQADDPALWGDECSRADVQHGLRHLHKAVDYVLGMIELDPALKAANGGAGNGGAPGVTLTRTSGDRSVGPGLEVAGATLHDLLPPT